MAERAEYTINQGTEIAARRSDEEPEKIDLLPVFRRGMKQLQRTWLLALVLVIITAGLGYIRERKSYVPRYRISASFVVNSTSSEITNSSYYDKVTTEQLNQTFPYILTSGALEQIVCADLGVESLPGVISANPLGETNLFQFSVTGKDPKQIARVLDSVIENYPEVAKYIIGTTQLKLLEKQPVPQTPVNLPNYRSAVVRYGLVGAIIYLAFLLFQILTNQTVQSKCMLLKHINLSSMGHLPKVKQQKRHKERPILLGQEVSRSGYYDAMVRVYSRILHKITRQDKKVIYITSSIAGEGKTTTACNLALMMAQREQRVILIDGDLRNPSVAKTLEIEQGDAPVGLIDLLAGNTSLDEIYAKCAASYEGAERLTVIPGGKAVGKIHDVFSNGRFEKLIAYCRKQADVVIVDTPPCSFIHDTAAIASYMDGGFMVIRQDYAPIDRVVSGAELLAKTEAPLMGFVLNFSEG